MNQPKSTEKPFAIPKRAVVEAFKKVRENQGGPGVDGCTIEEFESELRDRLYLDFRSFRWVDGCGAAPRSWLSG